MKVSKIIEQSEDYLKLEVPSKSSPTDNRTITFYPSGKHFCSCPGHEWKVIRKSYTLPNHKKWCRHHSLTTLPILEMFKDRTYFYISQGYIKAAWRFIGCQFPEYYNEMQLHCTRCPLYPETCNIHPIRFGKHNTRKPLVWRLQTAIFNKHRAASKKLFRRFCRITKEVKDERETILPNDP